MTTTDGAVIRARRFVASGLNPQQTFLALMAKEDVPADWRNKAGAFAYDRLAPLFALNLCLDEAPHYAAADLRQTPVRNRSFSALQVDNTEASDGAARHRGAAFGLPRAAR